MRIKNIPKVKKPKDDDIEFDEVKNIEAKMYEDDENYFLRLEWEGIHNGELVKIIIPNISLMDVDIDEHNNKLEFKLHPDKDDNYIIKKREEKPKEVKKWNWF